MEIKLELDFRKSHDCLLSSFMSTLTSGPSGQSYRRSWSAVSGHSVQSVEIKLELDFLKYHDCLLSQHHAGAYKRSVKAS